MNGDGAPDIAAVSNFDQPIDILFGDGTGSFHEAKAISDSMESGAAGLLLTDLDGDGNLDLVIPHCCGQADGTFLLGNGDGTFQSEQQFLCGSSPTTVAATKLGSNTQLLCVDRAGTMVTTVVISPAVSGSTAVAKTAR